jgi:hypothetical protein
MLTFNGTLLELTGTRRQQVSIIEEEELTLPLVPLSIEKKSRSHTMG